MQESSNGEVTGVCRGLVDSFQGSLAWKWDDRFGAALAAFNTDDKSRIQAIIEAHLAHVWESSSIGKAPLNVATASQNYGGLSPGQQLYTSDPDKEEFLLGLCWPWGNGETISIRFIPNYVNLSEQESTEKLEEFRGIFGL